MTYGELAAILNGREYREEITREESRLAAAAGLLVVFGASDDLTELRGVIDDEVGSCDGANILISDDNKVIPDEDEIEREERETLEKFGVLQIVIDRIENARVITALWCNEPDYSWTFTTELPHATFDIMEGDEKFCRGLVVDLAATKEAA